MKTPGLLKKIKGKVLDKEHYELLRRVWDLQEQNLDVVRSANRTLTENNHLLKEKIRRLEHENNQLRRSLVEKQLVGGPGEISVQGKHILEISDITVAILQECMKRDVSEFTAAEMAGCLGQAHGEVKAAIAELVESGLIREDRSGRKRTVFSLTDTGRNYAKTL